MHCYQDGDIASFETLYWRHSGRVYAYLRLRTRRPTEAEDLLQQIFLKVHQHRARYDASLPFLPWLFSITRHALIDHLRRRRAVPTETQALIALADRAAAAPPEPDVPAHWDEVLSLLPEEQKQLLRQRFQEGLGYDEIARAAGINETSARKRVSRAVQSLRRFLLGEREGVTS